MVEGVWRPIPRQEDLILCPYSEILYGGGVGGGKSEGLVGDFLAWHAKWGRSAKGLLLRKTYSELGDLIAKSRKIIGAAYGQSCFSKSEFIWNLPTGGSLKLAYLDEYDDWYNHQGFEYTWMGWDELTQWERDGELVLPDGRKVGTNRAYIQMMSRLRGTLPDMSDHPVRTVATTNPGGPGHTWVKQRFIDVGPPEVPTYHTVKVLTDQGEKSFTKSRIFLPSLVKDNPYLANSSYLGTLAMLNPSQRDMLLYGKWDVIEGQFFHEWDHDVHVIPYFYPPKEWPRFMGADWGTSDPYCILWGAKAPNGDKYIYRELYGDGSHETASSVRDKILSIEAEYGETVVERYLDSSCFSKIGFESPIANQFEPVHFEPAHRSNKPGAMNIVREHLKVVNGKSRAKIMDNCRNLIRIIPSLTVDTLRPELYKDKQEDHPLDAFTYMLRGSMPIEIETGLAKYLGRHYDTVRESGQYGAH